MIRLTDQSRWRPTDQEHRAAESLLQFQSLIRKSESRNRQRGSSPSNVAAAAPAMVQKPPPLELELSMNVVSSSPDTPLAASFSGSSSDPKSGAAGRNSKKETKDQVIATGPIEPTEKEFPAMKEIKEAASLLIGLKIPQKPKELIPEKTEQEKVSTELTLGIQSELDPVPIPDLTIPAGANAVSGGSLPSDKRIDAARARQKRMTMMKDKQARSSPMKIPQNPKELVPEKTEQEKVSTELTLGSPSQLDPVPIPDLTNPAGANAVTGRGSLPSDKRTKAARARQNRMAIMRAKRLKLN